MSDLKNFIEKDIGKYKKEYEDLWDKIVPDVVQSYDWESDMEEGFEVCEFEWYDSYAHTTGYQAEYESAEQWLINSVFESTEENQEVLMDTLDIRYYY